MAQRFITNSRYFKYFTSRGSRPLLKNAHEPGANAGSIEAYAVTSSKFGNAKLRLAAPIWSWPWWWSQRCHFSAEPNSNSAHNMGGQVHHINIHVHCVYTPFSSSLCGQDHTIITSGSPPGRGSTGEMNPPNCVDRKETQ